MKEPWQVFHDELRRQLGRYDVDVSGPDAGLRRVPEAAVPGMSNAIANTVLEHLTALRGLDQENALEVTQLFFTELSKQSSEPLAERLERVWRQWAEDK